MCIRDSAHWSLELKRTYTFVNLADPELAIQWPIPLAEATVSEADLNHPMLRDVAVSYTHLAECSIRWQLGVQDACFRLRLARLCERGRSLRYYWSEQVCPGYPNSRCV